MAGMFYSLQEAAQKLNKTEEQLKQIVKEGKLREFRDGSNLLFRIDEVNALAAEMGIAEPQQQPESTPPSTEPQKSAEQPPQNQTEEELSLADENSQQQEPADEQQKMPPESQPEEHKQPHTPPSQEPDEELKLADQETQLADEQPPDIAELGTGEETALAGQADTDLDLAGDDTDHTAPALDETILETTGKDEAEKTSFDDDLTATSDETALGQLSEQESSSDEMSLENIDDDVNLDASGSGSGLLDLSLQADDTSLGGILDEIYTPEGEAQESTAEGDIEESLESQPTIAEEAAAPAATLRHHYVEPEPDAMSNALGIMMFIPLLLVIYTIVVLVAEFTGMAPAILGKIHTFKGPYQIPLIWYIVAGSAGLAAITAGAGAAMSGSPKTRKPRAKKQKSSKKKKPPKNKSK